MTRVTDLAAAARQPAPVPESHQVLGDLEVAMRVATEEALRLSQLSVDEHPEELLRQWQSVGQLDKVSEHALYVKLEAAAQRVSLVGHWHFPNTEARSVLSRVLFHAQSSSS